MKDIFVFRHGETDWNVEDRIQGQTDTPLNANGILQAAELAQRLSLLKLDVIVSSPLLRARQTAEIANQQLQIPLFFADELKEAYLGKIEGMRLPELYLVYGKDYFFKWRSGLKIHDEINFPEAESKVAILHRVVSFVTQFAMNSPYQRIGISTHGFVIRRLLASVDESLPLNGQMPNVSIWHLKLNLAGKLEFLKTT